jgi:hypothetical protein
MAINAVARLKTVLAFSSKKEQAAIRPKSDRFGDKSEKVHSLYYLTPGAKNRKFVQNVASYQEAVDIYKKMVKKGTWPKTAKPVYITANDVITHIPTA